VETAKGKSREEIINRLSDRIDSFENYASPHARLMADLASHLGRRMGLTEPDINAATEAALLHDIGLYAMTPAYHSTPGPLTFEERMDLWRHPIIGEQQMAKRDAMRHAQLLVRWHHEWWNGSGYPDMLAFEDIPIGARILRAVELYSALISDRPYRAALNRSQAIETLKAAAGIECDPYVVKALIALLEDINAQTEVAAPGLSTEAQASAGEMSSLTQAEPHSGSPESSQGDAERTQLRESPSAFDAGATPWASAHAGEHSEWPPRAAVGPPGGPLTGPAATGFAQEPPEAQARSAQETHDAEDRTLETRAAETRQPVPPNSSGAESAVTERESRPAGLGGATRPAPIARWGKARARDFVEAEPPRWHEWASSRYNKKSLLGYEASVLRQIEFRSIAIPFTSLSRLDWYLKAWGKLILANDPRAWAGMAARAMAEAKEPLSEDHVMRLLEDVYVPGARLNNPELRRWFSETDAWWMDNLRRNIEALDDETLRAQAMVLGMKTGDYALSFNEETRDLRRPLTTIFWRLAGRAFIGPAGHPHSRGHNLPAEEFLKRARADLVYVSLPAAHTEQAGSEARSPWRESWVRASAGGGDEGMARLMTAPQSKQSYLALIDKLLRSASHIKTWAIGYQEIGLAAASDIAELVKEYRPVRATYSKDLTEVAGGLRSFIIIAEKASA
jgi:ribosomal protein L12E/L44/L45/RPP1/RPP2